MGIIEKIVISDEKLRELEKDALKHGRSVAEEAAARIEAPPSHISRDELIARMRALGESLPPQRTDSLTLLREDRRSEEKGEPVDWVARARQVRAMSPKGAVQTDSVRIIREDRERGHSIDRH